MEVIGLGATGGIKAVWAFFLKLAVEISDGDCSPAIDKYLELDMPQPKCTVSWLNISRMVVKFEDDSTIPVTVFIPLMAWLRVVSELGAFLLPARM